MPEIIVQGRAQEVSYQPKRATTATRTDAALRDVPHAVLPAVATLRRSSSAMARDMQACAGTCTHTSVPGYTATGCCSASASAPTGYCEAEAVTWLAAGQLARADFVYLRDLSERRSAGVDAVLADVLGMPAVDDLIAQGHYRRDVY